MDDYKKGGRIRRKKMMKPKKKVVRVATIRERRPKLKKIRTDDKIYTQPAFEMFGYKLPQSNAPINAPGKPIDEEAYSKISQLYQKTSEEKTALEKKLKEIEEAKNLQLVPSPAIKADYEKMMKKVQELENKQRDFYTSLQQPSMMIEEKKTPPVIEEVVDIPMIKATSTRIYTKKGEPRVKQTFKGGNIIIEDITAGRGRPPTKKKTEKPQKPPTPPPMAPPIPPPMMAPVPEKKKGNPMLKDPEYQKMMAERRKQKMEALKKPVKASKTKKESD